MPKWMEYAKGYILIGTALLAAAMFYSQTATMPERMEKASNTIQNHENRICVIESKLEKLNLMDSKLDMIIRNTNK